MNQIVDQNKFCEICDKSSIETKETKHRILGDSILVFCNSCGHRSFRPIRAEAREDKRFSDRYAKTQQHFQDYIRSFKTRKYFIDYSRLVLISHFKYLNDGMRILELGPGFPGLFQQLKLTQKDLSFFAIESEAKSRRLLMDYGIKLIGAYFRLEEYKNYEGMFDVIVACNILYYFDQPIEALKQMMHLLNGDGIILIDILNDRIIDDNYYKNNTMSHIFSKESLSIAIERAGGVIKFMSTCCVKDPQAAFNNIARNDNFIKSNIIGRISRKVGKLLLCDEINYNSEIMSYFAQATQLKYGHPEGQYIRAIISK